MENLIVIEIFKDNTSQVWSADNEQDLFNSVEGYLEGLGQDSTAPLDIQKCASILESTNGKVYILPVEQAIEAYRTNGDSINLTTTRRDGTVLDNLQEELDQLEVTYVDPYIVKYTTAYQNELEQLRDKIGDFIQEELRPSEEFKNAEWTELKDLSDDRIGKFIDTLEVPDFRGINSEDLEPVVRNLLKEEQHLDLSLQLTAKQEAEYKSVCEHLRVRRSMRI
jgi:hypothetical protein